MINLYKKGAWLINGTELMEDGPEAEAWIHSLTGKNAQERRGSEKYHCVFYSC